MSWIAGFDISTKAIDCVLVPESADSALIPHHRHFELFGEDAWERARSISDIVPGRGWWQDYNLYAAGIEVPFGFSSAKVSMVIGALLNRLPRDILIERWPHNSWRVAMGLKGGGKSEALKAAATAKSQSLLLDAPPTEYRSLYRRDIALWPVDAHEAHLIALATRAALERQAAA